MFRALRARVGILSLARPPLRVHSAIQQNGYPIERVRFEKPVLRPKVVLGHLVASGICLWVFHTVVSSPLSQFAGELEELDEDEDEDEDVEHDGVFIPFPFTTKTMQPPPYRGTDPEWQEYLKFSKNRALGQRIRDELAATVEAAANATPGITNECGKSIKLRKYWLDVDFPMGPPPEFLRSGIEIRPGLAVSWKTMPVDSQTVFRIRQALWPSAITQSLWSFSKVLFTQDTASIAGMLGLQTKSQPSFEQIPMKHTKRATKLGKTGPLSKDTQTPSAATTETHGEGQQADSNSAVEKNSYKMLDGVAGTAQDKAPQEIAPNLLRVQTLKAYTAFKAKFRETWTSPPSYHPRGSIVVSGLVELDSPHAWIVIDVRAAWDPKTKDYDPRCMQLAIRRLQRKKQEPFRGP